MKTVGCLAVITAFALAGIAGVAVAQTTTLSIVKERGALNCGVNGSLPGFSQSDGQGNWYGLDVDYCKAVAAAIFGDADKVKYTPITASERFKALQSRQIDVLIRNTTWSIERESTLGLNFAGVNYFDGQGFLVKAANGIKSIKDLDGSTICVGRGTTTELNLADYFRFNNIVYKPLVFDRLDETIQAYLADRCSAFTADQSALYANRVQLSKPRDHVVLPEIISKEPLGPSVARGDIQWLTVIKWVHFALINAEELGITQANVDQMGGSANPAIKRFLGKDGDFGKGLGLDIDFAVRIVKAVGNYGEVFERNVGTDSRLKIARGPNNLWNKGGLQYAPPFR